MPAQDMSAILEHDETKRLEVERKLEPLLAEIMKDSAHHADGIIFASEYFEEQKKHWMGKLLEAVV
jgi:hypothetical protein